MEWLNYHHLRYFCAVARTGSISRASEELHVSSPAISAQLRSLEDSLGEKLFLRSGRRLVLTDVGRVVLNYGEEIFTLGREMLHRVKDQPTGRPLRLIVGVVDVLPKMIAQWLIAPALKLREAVHLVCREGGSNYLASQLAMHELDVVLSDEPVSPGFSVRLYNHLLGECGVTFVATPRLAKNLKADFPRSLHHAPMLLPAVGTGVRRDLDSWFEQQEIRPQIVGEFQDHALLRAFAQEGTGVFAIPSVFEKHLQQQDSLQSIGAAGEIRNRFYAISAERRLKNSAVLAICSTARKLFG